MLDDNVLALLTGRDFPFPVIQGILKLLIALIFLLLVYLFFISHSEYIWAFSSIITHSHSCINPFLGSIKTHSPHRSSCPVVVSIQTYGNISSIVSIDKCVGIGKSCV